MIKLSVYKEDHKKFGDATRITAAQAKEFPTSYKPIRGSDPYSVSKSDEVKLRSRPYFASASDPSPYKLFELAKTQKAKGIIGLIRLYDSLGARYFSFAKNNIKLLPYSEPEFPCFARPCPIVPRHGFVDSRMVETPGELIALYDEVKRADPEGEVICMPKLTGKFSAVATPEGVTWGKGHDGATTGTGQTFHIPTANSFSDWEHMFEFSPIKFDKAFGVETNPYMELVEDKGEILAVQMRDGPKQPKSKNFIPERVIVKNILRVSNYEFDFLAWENAVEKAEPGTVIYFPDGTLSSHFAVHGIVNKIPVICDKVEPVIGSTLKPESLTVKPLSNSECVTLTNSIKAWSLKPFKKLFNSDGESHASNEQFAIFNIVATNHAMHMWNGDPHLLRLRGFAFAMLPRFIAAACLGECRHWYAAGPGREKHDPCVDWKALIGRNLSEPRYDERGEVIGTSHTVERDIVYENVLNNLDLDLETLLAQAIDDLESDGWRKGSYGGQAWANAATECLTYMKMFSYVKSLSFPSPAEFNKLHAQMNKLILTVHNGGKVVTKWASDYDLKIMNETSAFGFLNRITLSILDLKE